MRRLLLACSPRRVGTPYDDAAARRFFIRDDV
jgi:transposase InsO family protein